MNSSSINGRVLSIQSHVVHGYVGGKCAIFALQMNGFEVDPIHSVQFSNHTGYPAGVKGHAFDGEHLMQLLSGLEANGIKSYTHLLTGFIGSKSLLDAISKVAGKLKEWNGDKLEFLMDPVLGDEGRIYVKEEMIEAYRESIHLATILVPNSFEAELLTNIQIRSVSEGFAACEALHRKGPHTVIITSLQTIDDPDSIEILCSTKKTQDRGTRFQKLTVRVPKIKAYFTGTGDLLAALILATLGRHPSDLATALEEALSSLQAVLKDTADACGEASFASERTSEVCRARELRLIQNRRHLMTPPTPSPFKAIPWDTADKKEN